MSNRPELKHRNLILEIDRNPYELNFYNSKARTRQVIIFPIFHYEGLRQYYDLLAPIIKKGYPVITVNLLTKKDRVLFFNYYFKIFKDIIFHLVDEKFIDPETEITLMGFGVGAYLVSNYEMYKEFNIKKLILLSPVNQYRDEHQISAVVASYPIPTYFHFGQLDSVTNIDNRARIFENGHKNPNVHFSCYPISGHYFYYKDLLSIRIEELYSKRGYDGLIGDWNKYRTSALPEKALYNERFFTHLYNELENIPNKQRIALLTDIFPLFVNGVSVVVGLLQKELEALGYEVYIVALWNKESPYRLIPSDTYIPVEATYASFLKGYKELEMLKTLNFTKHAKMLSLFGFDYLHLHTEYSMSKIALKLGKIADIKVLYTYHTLWNLYYEHKFGKLIGDITYKAAKGLLFNDVYKECDIITVPSKKSYEILKKESKNKVKDIRMIPSSIDVKKFEITHADLGVIKDLKKKYHLDGKKVLGYVGRVSMEKNIIETLEYIAKIKHEIPNIIFLIVGVGDAIEPLKKEIKRLKIEEYVTFVGEIENSELKYYYNLFDVFVTASNFETQGLTYFEAAASNTLILAKADEAIVGIFKDYHNAYIYHDFYDWTEKLEKALFGNNEEIISNARKTLDEYAPDLWAKKILAIYKELNDK